MKLKEKTHKKFVEFFAEKNRANRDQEFEIAFSEIQRTTGTASVTLKRALNKLVEEGIISMVPGRNSRYARFAVLGLASSGGHLTETSKQEPHSFGSSSWEQEIDLLKRRLRSQEIAISLLQDRLANLEEKLKL